MNDDQNNSDPQTPLSLTGSAQGSNENNQQLNVPLLTRAQTNLLLGFLRNLAESTEVEERDETIMTLGHSTLPGSTEVTAEAEKTYGAKIILANVVASAIFQASSTLYSRYYGVEHYSGLRKFLFNGFVIVDIISILCCIVGLVLYFNNPRPNRGSIQQIGAAYSFTLASIGLLALAFVLAWLTVLL